MTGDYFMLYFEDEGLFHCRLVRETSELDFETRNPIYFPVARACLNQEELTNFKGFADTLNAEITQTEPPYELLGFGDLARSPARPLAPSNSRD